MNTCPHCGYLMPETWVTCRRCQSPVPARVPEPALSVPAGAGFPPARPRHLHRPPHRRGRRRRSRT